MRGRGAATHAALVTVLQVRAVLPERAAFTALSLCLMGTLWCAEADLVCHIAAADARVPLPQATDSCHKRQV